MVDKEEAKIRLTSDRHINSYLKHLAYQREHQKIYNKKKKEKRALMDKELVELRQLAKKMIEEMARKDKLIGELEKQIEMFRKM